MATVAGKRKTAIAKVTLVEGQGNITVNGKDFAQYFANPSLQALAKTALSVVELEDNFDLKVRVAGGGMASQADAVKYGIAKALLAQSSELRDVLKENGLLTRDARVKERKKPGLRKARRARQFSKR